MQEACRFQPNKRRSAMSLTLMPQWYRILRGSSKQIDFAKGYVVIYFYNTDVFYLDITTRGRLQVVQASIQHIV